FFFCVIAAGPKSFPWCFLESSLVRHSDINGEKGKDWAGFDKRMCSFAGRLGSGRVRMCMYCRRRQQVAAARSTRTNLGSALLLCGETGRASFADAKEPQMAFSRPGRST